jgi:F0F1-type ATP synthase gamma subunit
MRLQQIKSELSFLESFGALAQSLQEVSMLRMQAVRSFVESSRLFHSGLAEIYRNIKESSLIQFKNKKVENRRLLKKSVAVLFSANTRMYGTIVDEVYHSFKKYTGRHPDDLVIIGKIGKERYDVEPDKRGYTYFDLKDAGIIYMDLISILSHIMEYEEITVFYGQFNSIFSQQATQKSVPGNVIFDLQGEPITLKPVTIFFLEPSQEELETFFSGQVIGLLFRHAAYEFELSRHASRVRTLEQALDQTLSKQKKTALMLHHLKKNNEIKRQAHNIAYFMYKRK